MLKDHFTNVVIHKVITKLVNNYRAYDSKKTKMIKLQHVLYTKFNEWFDDCLWKTNEGSLKKTKLNFSVIVLGENKQS